MKYVKLYEDWTMSNSAAARLVSQIENKGTFDLIK